MPEPFRFRRPSPAWTAEDRLAVVQALCELIERDLHRGTYGRVGRPNFMAIYHVLHEPADVLESFRDSTEQVLQQAERERGSA